MNDGKWETARALASPSLYTEVLVKVLRSTCVASSHSEHLTPLRMPFKTLHHFEQYLPRRSLGTGKSRANLKPQAEASKGSTSLSAERNAV